jgi:type IV secretion system pilin
MQKNKFYSLILLTLFTAGMFVGVKTASAEYTQDQVCKYVNYQYASVEDKEGDTSSTPFAGEMVTIAEERLGAPDGVITFNCFRVIDCSMKVVKQAKGYEGPEVKARKCVAKYEKECSGGATDEDLIEAYGTPDKEYKICEPVMIYISSAGNQLLYYYMGQIYKFAATIGALLAVLILIVAGIMYSTAGDNNTQTTAAKGLMVKCISGLVVLFLSALILVVINPNFFAPPTKETPSTTESTAPPPSTPAP